MEERKTRQMFIELGIPKNPLKLKLWFVYTPFSDEWLAEKALLYTE